MKKKLLLLLFTLIPVFAFSQWLPITMSFQGANPGVNSQDSIRYNYSPGKVGGYSYMYNAEYIRTHFVPSTGGGYVPNTRQILNGFAVLGGTQLNVDITKSVDSTKVLTIDRFKYLRDTLHTKYFDTVRIAGDVFGYTGSKIYYNPSLNRTEFKGVGATYAGLSIGNGSLTLQGDNTIQFGVGSSLNMGLNSGLGFYVGYTSRFTVVAPGSTSDRIAMLDPSSGILKYVAGNTYGALAVNNSWIGTNNYSNNLIFGSSSVHIFQNVGNTFQTSLTGSNATHTNNISLPDTSGTLAVRSDLNNITSGPVSVTAGVSALGKNIALNGGTANAHAASKNSIDLDASNGAGIYSANNAPSGTVVIYRNAYFTGVGNAITKKVNGSSGLLSLGNGGVLSYTFSPYGPAGTSTTTTTPFQMDSLGNQTNTGKLSILNTLSTGSGALIQGGTTKATSSGTKYNLKLVDYANADIATFWSDSIRFNKHLVMDKSIFSNSGQSFLTYHDTGFMSFYNSAFTTRTGYLQFNAGGAIKLVSENATGIELNGAPVTLDHNLNVNANAIFTPTTGYAIESKGDISVYRASTPTIGVVSFGSSGTHYINWDGTKFNFTDNVTAPNLPQIVGTPFRAVGKTNVGTLTTFTPATDGFYLVNGVFFVNSLTTNTLQAKVTATTPTGTSVSQLGALASAVSNPATSVGTQIQFSVYAKGGTPITVEMTNPISAGSQNYDVAVQITGYQP